MAEHYRSCSEFIATGRGALPVYMFEEDFERIKHWVLNYPDLETGGDLFGLWTSDERGLKPLIHIVLGPGKGCKRTEYSFFQDVPYLKRAGSALTDTYMLGHIGEWHSHHGLSLVEPSIGDYNTVKRNYPQGFHGFLLLIANILPNSEVSLSPYMFRETSKVERCRVVLLAGKSPFRREAAIKATIERGVEVATRARQPAERTMQLRSDRPNRARLTAVEVMDQSGDTAAASKYSTKSSSHSSNSQEWPKHRVTRVPETTRPTNQPGGRPLPPAPDYQWYSTKDGRAEIQRVRQSFERIDGTKDVQMTYSDSDNNVCFTFKRKNSLWVVEFPATYPQGRTMLKCSSQTSNTVEHTVQGTNYSDNMTTIISYIRNKSAQ